MIARNDPNQLVEKAAAASPGDQIVCEPDDAVVVMKWGAIQRILAAGHHPVEDSGLDVYFVRAVAKPGIRAGGPAGSITDEASGIEVGIRAMLEYALRVTDPAGFLTSLATSLDDGDDVVVKWVSSQVLAAVKSVVGEQHQALRIVGDPMALADSILQRTRDSLAGTGLEVAELESLMLSMSSDDMATLRAAMSR